MSPRLGVGHEAEHAVRDGLGAVGHGGTVDDLRYFRRAAVVVAAGGTVTMVVIVGECTSGISGDMCAAALLDAGASEEAVRRALESLPVEGFCRC